MLGYDARMDRESGDGQEREDEDDEAVEKQDEKRSEVITRCRGR